MSVNINSGEVFPVHDQVRATVSMWVDYYDLPEDRRDDCTDNLLAMTAELGDGDTYVQFCDMLAAEHPFIEALTMQKIEDAKLLAARAARQTEQDIEDARILAQLEAEQVELAAREERARLVSRNWRHVARFAAQA